MMQGKYDHTNPQETGMTLDSFRLGGWHTLRSLCSKRGSSQLKHYRNWRKWLAECRNNAKEDITWCIYSSKWKQFIGFCCNRCLEEQVLESTGSEPENQGHGLGTHPLWYRSKPDGTNIYQVFKLD